MCVKQGAYIALLRLHNKACTRVMSCMLLGFTSGALVGLSGSGDDALVLQPRFDDIQRTGDDGGDESSASSCNCMFQLI